MLLGIQFTADNLVAKRREVSWTLTKKLRLSSAGPGEIKREVSWTLTKKLRLSFAGPGEIKRTEVSWTLTKKLDFRLRVQARSRGGRWCWTLKSAQKRSRAGRWSWALKVGLLLLQLFYQQQCYGHCPCDSAPHSS